MWKLDSDETLLIYRNTHNFKQSKMSSKRKNENNQSTYKSKLFKSMVKPSLSLSQKVKRIIHSQEEKKEITTFGSAVMTTTASVANVISLASIAEGLDYNNRVGKRIIIQGVYMDLAFKNNGATDDYGIWWLVQDKQPNGNQPGQADIMDITATTGNAFPNHGKNGYTDRFRVLAQDVWSCELAGDQIDRKPRRYVKLKDFHVQYGVTTAGVGVTNGLYLVLGSALTNSSTCSYNIRVTFTDS